RRVRLWKGRSPLPQSTSCRRLRSKAGYSVSLRPPCSASAKGSLVVIGRRPYLSSKDGVADDGVDQHQREDDDARAPEHESQTGMGCGGFLDRDRERDHVRPERNGQGAERSRENQRHHVKRHTIPAAPNALGRHERRDDTDRREHEQGWPLEPSVHDLKIFGQGVYEYNNQEGEQSNRQIGDPTIGFFADIAFAFPDQPASTEQGIAET